MKNRRADFVLALALNARGLAFVLFEGQLTPHDWGIVECRGTGRHQRMYHKALALIERYHPDVVALPDFTQCGHRRSEALRKTIFRIEHAARMAGSGVARSSREQVRTVFANFGARTKVEIADAIATAIPAFSHRLPPTRKIWISEDRRQLLFDAAALGWVTYLGLVGED